MARGRDGGVTGKEGEAGESRRFAERESEGDAQKKSPKPLQVADFDDDVRPDAKDDEKCPLKGPNILHLLAEKLGLRSKAVQNPVQSTPEILLDL